MKIATLSAGLFVTAGILLQSCAGIIIAPSIAGTEAKAGAGIIIALLGTFTAAMSIFALAYVRERPGVAAAAYLVASLFAFFITPLFWDMEIWRVALFALAIMAFVSWQLGRKRQLRLDNLPNL